MAEQNRRDGFWVDVTQNWREEDKFQSRPIRVGGYNSITGDRITAPDWLHDKVLPPCLPNGLDYQNMMEYIEIHESNSVQFMETMKRNGGLHGAEIELWTSWLDQQYIISTMKIHLKDILKGQKLLENNPETMLDSWLADRVVPDYFYQGLTTEQMLAWIHQYEDECWTAYDVMAGNYGLSDGAFQIHRAWVLGEQITDELCLYLKTLIDGLLNIIEDGLPNELKGRDAS